MYCEYFCCFPCLFIMRVCDEYYKYCSCKTSDNKIHTVDTE